MEIQGSSEVLTESRLRDFEGINGLQLPQQYREFLLKHNGGYPKPYYFTISREQGMGMVNVFYGIGEMYDDLDKKIHNFDEILEAGFIPIADDSGGNQICLGLTEAHFGHVYFWIHDEDPEDMGNMFFLSKDFGEFLERLHEISED
ncbi:SMI1/KNR4 family protein [Paenibacillus sp. FSL R7-0337]|uniref:SMI1/KNR4 family protein n=1 Tax=Paenibacillus sp. FSL R7-0337 TaxID=1926588 RepID=UPI0009701156|nr:SMI1/KNR4 family protein [Paenibacillus sp. FSL R7-0337]OMF94221.1 SMI1/KNR4 family protein [Paenibacillus sp. FSL R7-0337]